MTTSCPKCGESRYFDGKDCYVCNRENHKQRVLEAAKNIIDNKNRLKFAIQFCDVSYDDFILVAEEILKQKF